SGVRYLVVKTDKDNRVNECAFENDNINASSPVTITLTPPPDLQVVGIQMASNVFSAESLALSWTVTNAGPGIVGETTWFDDVFLSLTPVLTTNAIPLGSFLHVGALTNGQIYSTSASVTLPPSLSGNYYLLVQTDSRSNVFEDT